MKDLVFVKFNSRLKQKKDDMDKDPIEKRVHYVVLEDEDNKWITGIEPTKGDEEQEEETETSSQGVAAASQREIEERTKRVNWQKLRSRKRNRLIPSFPTFEEEESSPSSDEEDENDIDMLSRSDSEAEP
jgi:hypothetical protein